MSKQGELVYSSCGEVFNCDTPDFDEGDTYYEGAVQEIKPSELVSEWTVDTILDQMDEALYEEVGEVAEDNLYLSDESKKELLGIVEAFIENNAKISCYKVVDIKEKVMEV